MSVTAGRARSGKAATSYDDPVPSLVHVIGHSATANGSEATRFDNPNDSLSRRSASAAKETRDDSYILT